MTNLKVLISGASAAGPALASWLHRHGFHATIAERTPAPRRRRPRRGPPDGPAPHGLFADRPDREEPALLNATLQAAYLIRGVRAAGPMTGFDFPGVHKEFLDDDYTPVTVVDIGRPAADAWFPRPPRPACHEVVITV